MEHISKLKILFPAFFLLIIPFTSLAQTPFAIKVVDKPASISVGQKYIFSFDVGNKSKEPITMSSSCAVSADLTWFNEDGRSGGGTGSGCGTSHVPENSFFTLQPKEKKRFQLEVEIPDNVKAAFITANLRFAPNAKGTEYGLNAIIGSATATVKLPVSLN